MMKALIAMSGGVDSSVTAALMKEKGYECVGVMMRLYDGSGAGGGAAGVSERPDGTGGGAAGVSERPDGAGDDTADARAAAARLGIPFGEADFRADFRCRVMDPFVESYLQGSTPNPCIDCNRHLKFAKLYEKAEELGCSVIATGHYVNCEQDQKTGRYLLKKAADPVKDQSYVLYSLTQEQLAHTVFPLGQFTKEEVRMLAEELCLLNADKKDSQDICFIPDGNYKRFIEEYGNVTCEPGSFVAEDGTVLGQHRGIIYYTIGQRKGLGISAGAPLFVKEIRPETNEVVLSDNASLFQDTLYARNFNWIAVEGLGEGETLRVNAKIRYRHKESPAAATVENGMVKVVFDEPQRAVTKGQAVVLYDGDVVVGGGTICGVGSGMMDGA